MFQRSGIAAGIALLCMSAPAIADHQPAIVKPSFRGIPPLIDDIDVTGWIIEGDWGLYRPGAGSVTYYPNGALLMGLPPRGGYYPATGRRPRSGRLEILPPRNRRLPPPAPSYHRSWSSDAPSRVTTDGGGYAAPISVDVFPQQRRRPRPHRHSPPRRR